MENIEKNNIIKKKHIKFNEINDSFYDNFIKFINCDDDKEKNRLFSECLYPVLNKIIYKKIMNENGFKYHQIFETKEELFFDILSHLYENFNKFDQTRSQTQIQLVAFLNFQCLFYLRSVELEFKKKIENEIRINQMNNEDEYEIQIEDEDQLNNIENLFTQINQTQKITNNIKKIIEQIKFNKHKYYKNEYEKYILVGESLLKLFTTQLEEFNEIIDVNEQRKYVYNFIQKDTKIDDMVLIHLAIYKFTKKLYDLQ